jgi:hypothetical protein
VEIPVDRFYYGPFLTGRPKGVVARFSGLGNHNLSKINDLMFQIFSDQQYLNQRIIPSYGKTYLKIAYTDALGNKHIQYCKSELYVEPIDAERWESIFKTSKQISIDIDKLNPNELIRIFGDIISKDGIPSHIQMVH